jgi:hypothetical protein
MCVFLKCLLVFYCEVLLEIFLCLLNHIFNAINGEILFFALSQDVVTGADNNNNDKISLNSIYHTLISKINSMDELDALTEFLLKRWKILKIRHLMKNEKKM